LKSELKLAKRSELHLMRRFWHLFCGVVCLISYYSFSFEAKTWAIVALIVASLGFILDFRRLKSPELNEFLTKCFGPIMRRSEKYSFSGLPFYALGASLSLFLFKEEIAILAISFLIFADPAASIAGVYLGRDRLFPNKTLQGTITAFLVCFIVCLVYFWLNNIQSPNIIIFAFFGSIIGALSELLSAFNIDDNLTIPVVSGAALSAFNYWLLIF